MKYSTIKLNIAESAKVTGATKVYQNRNAFPAGDTTWEGIYGFAQDSDRLYLHTGQGWFNIAIINTTPLWITEPAASYSLASDATAYNNGTATEITLSARDSEGFPITWSYEANAAMNNIANISQDSSSNATMKFTIEPATEDSAGSGTPDAGTLTFKASDGINTLSKAATFTLTFDYSITGSENSTSLIKGIGNNGVNSSFADKATTGNTHTISKSGDPQQGSFSPYSPSGYSWYFNGVDNVVKYSDHADWALGGSDWTIEFWVNPSHHRQYDTICAIVGTLAIEQKDGSLHIWMSTNGSSWDMASETKISYYIPVGKWTHFALVFDDTANTLKSYTNGSLTHTLSSLTGTMNDSSNELRIGQYTSNWWYGYISDFRWVKGSKVYTANFAPPTEALVAITNTKLLTCSRPWITGPDVSGNHNGTGAGDGTAGNTASVIPYTPYKVTKPYSATEHGGSAFFNGSTPDRLEATYHADFDVGSGAFTAECWIYPTAGGQDQPVLFGIWNGTDQYSWVLQLGESTNMNPRFLFKDGSGYNDNKATSVVVTAFSWNHIALARSSNTFTLYLNGVSVKTATISSAHSAASTNLCVGANTSGSQVFSGFMTDIRLCKGKAVYTGAFTPPTGPLTETGGTYPSNTNISNPSSSETVYLINCTDGKVIDEGGRANFQLYGAAKSSTGVSKFGSDPTVYFDGTDDAVRIKNGHNRFSEFPADFTIEGWYYTSEVNTQESLKWRTIWFCGTSTDLQLAWDHSNSKLVVYHDSTLITSSVATTLNTWQHVALTRSACVVDQALNITGGVLKLFLNGTEVGSATTANNVTLGNDAADGYIGAYDSTSGAMNGYLSDLRVSYGISRYPFEPLKETLTNTTSFQAGRTITSSHTKLITAHASSISDGSGTGHTVTAVSSAAVSTFAPKGGMYSVVLDGTDDSLKTGVSTDFRVTNDANWTIEGWFFFTTNPTTTQTHIFNYTDDSGFNWSAIEYMMYITTGGILTMEWAGGSGLIQHDIGNGTDFPLNQWHHIAVTCDSTNVHMFWNGTHCGSDNNAFTNTSNSSFLQIGRGCAGFNVEMGGYVSNFRFIKGSCAYTKDFTPGASTLEG